MVNYLVVVLQVKQQTEQTRKGHGTDKRPTFSFIILNKNWKIKNVMPFILQLKKLEIYGH